MRLRVPRGIDPLRLRARRAVLVLDIRRRELAASAFLAPVNSDWTSESAITEPGLERLDPSLRIHQPGPAVAPGTRQDCRRPSGFRHQPRRKSARRIATGLTVVLAHVSTRTWGVSVGVAPFVEAQSLPTSTIIRASSCPSAGASVSSADVRPWWVRLSGAGGDPLKPVTAGVSIFGVKLPTGAHEPSNERNRTCGRRLAETDACSPAPGRPTRSLGALFFRPAACRSSTRRGFAQVQ